MIRNALTYMNAYMGKYIKNEKGQTLVEYSLIIACVAVLIITVLLTFRESIEGVFTEIGEKLADPTSTP